MKPVLLMVERRDSILRTIVPKIEAASARKQRSVVIMCPDRPDLDYLFNHGGEQIRTKELPKELDGKLALRIILAVGLLATVFLISSVLMLNAGMYLSVFGCLGVGLILWGFAVDENFAARFTRPAGAAKEVWDYCVKNKLRPKMMRVRFSRYCDHGLQSNFCDESIVITVNW